MTRHTGEVPRDKQRHIPPASAWSRRLDRREATWAGSPVKLTAKTLMHLLPGLGRVVARMIRDKRSGAEPMWKAGLKAKPEMGVPLGGLGGGSVTRGWRGHFVRWQLRPGVYDYRTVPADQFSLWVRRGHGDPQAMVLAPKPDGVGDAGRGGGQGISNGTSSRGLAAWNWIPDESNATYHALFPRAWTVYEEPVPGIKVTCRQVSPVIPHDYRDSSLPVAGFVWTVENTGTDAAEVALMFSFQNGTGGANDLGGGHRNREFREPLGEGVGGGGDRGRDHDRGEVQGVLLEHRCRQAKVLRPGEGRNNRVVYEDPLTFAIAAQARDGVEVTVRPRFVIGADEARDESRSDEGAGTGQDAADLWREFASHGRLGAPDGGSRSSTDGADQPPTAFPAHSASSAPSSSGEVIGAAVCARTAIPPGGTSEMVFALVWDMPVARFGLGTPWHRRYTRFYGHDGHAAPALARDAVLRLERWEEAIEAWQAPVLSDPRLPDWYKSLLFNETYYLVDGGTIWTADPDHDHSAAGQGVGRFAYLEGHEYPMYNTYDVHFSASFALAMNWPLLELSLQRDFARAVGVEHPEEVTYLFSGKRAPRKVAGAVPHDLGSPWEDPWQLVNAYDAQDVSRWKDLNPKFVLQVYRDWTMTRDEAFLADTWPAVEKAVGYMARFDRDGDGLIENDGFPDQTYDVWSARGPSAYTGGLWLASLQAGAALARAAGRADRASEWETLLARGKEAYERLLWTGEYYLYDASKGRHSDSVMADQLAGHWFARACGLPGVVPDEHARAALRTVFALNVMGWGGAGHGRRAGTPKDGTEETVGLEVGSRGAVNGVRPDGKSDRSCMQSAEVWAGTTFSLAAAMLQAGMTGEAFATARGIYLSVYRDFPLWFQTPEAVDVNGVYRSLAYMRPLSVWAIQWELERDHETTFPRISAT